MAHLCFEGGHDLPEFLTVHADQLGHLIKGEKRLLWYWRHVSSFADVLIEKSDVGRTQSPSRNANAYGRRRWKTGCASNGQMPEVIQADGLFPAA